MMNSELVWSVNEIRMLRYMLNNDMCAFMRYFFKLREGNKMVLNWHHFIMFYVLQAVMDGKLNRLIINIAPGYTKTELAVINFIANALAIHPRAKFIHTSYSADLALENSSKIKETIASQEFQQLWRLKLRDDKDSKKIWYTEQGGGMIAAASGGQITGFRAGRMEEGFTGAFICDDPVKPDDAYSKVKRSAINNRFTNTMRSRLAVESVPMIIIMQRIHEEDLSGYLLRGGSGDKWHHLILPTLLVDDQLNKKYNKEYTHGIKLDVHELINCIKLNLDYEF